MHSSRRHVIIEPVRSTHSNTPHIGRQKSLITLKKQMFQSVARGQVNLDEIIQCSPTIPLRVKLFQNEKDSKDIKQTEVGSIEIAEILTIPTEGLLHIIYEDLSK